MESKSEEKDEVIKSIEAIRRTAEAKVLRIDTFEKHNGELETYAYRIKLFQLYDREGKVADLEAREINIEGLRFKPVYKPEQDIFRGCELPHFIEDKLAEKYNVKEVRMEMQGGGIKVVSISE